MSLKNQELEDYMHWLSTFLEEKEIDPEMTVFEFTNDNGVYNYMPLGVIIEGIAQLSRVDRQTIRTKIVQIDYNNGDVKHFFKYLAKGMSMSHPLF